MKSVLSEVIKIEIIKRVLSEGRVEDAKAKYPQDAEVVDYFVSQDSAGNNKYLPWMMKTYKQAPEGARQQAKELISQLVSGFHQHSTKLEKKDINQYKTLAELHSVITPLIKSTEEKLVKKEQEEAGVKKYYEDSDWLLLQPLTYESSCKYGANTKWCVASKDNKTHFKSYTKSGLLVFLIHKKSNHKFALYTDDDDYTYIEIYNPLDSDIAEGEMTVQEFLRGLVNGEMNSYLDRDDEGFGEAEYRLYKLKEDGTRRFLNDGEDEDDFTEEVIDEIWKYFFGRGTGKNTVDKYVKVLELFGFTLILDKPKRGKPISWSIKVSGADVDEGDDFKDLVDSGDLRILIREELDMDVDDVDDFIKTNKLPFVIEGPGIGSEYVNDLSNIMTKEQAKTINTSYTEIKEKNISEKREKKDVILSSLASRIKIKDEYLEKIHKCYNNKEAHFEDRYGFNSKVTDQFNSCLRLSLHMTSAELPIGLINPKSGRTLKRKIVDVWRLFVEELGRNENYNNFIYELLKKVK